MKSIKNNINIIRENINYNKKILQFANLLICKLKHLISLTNDFNTVSIFRN